MFCLILVGLILTLWGGREFLKSRMGAPPQNLGALEPINKLKTQHTFSSWSGKGSFLPGRVPPHVVDPITPWSTAYQKADRLVFDTQESFLLGKWEKTIEDLKFCADTYKEGGTHYGNPDIETAYLAEAYYHLFACYPKVYKNDEAYASLREAVRLFRKVKLAHPEKSQALANYYAVLSRGAANFEPAHDVWKEWLDENEKWKMVSKND